MPRLRLGVIPCFWLVCVFVVSLRPDHIGGEAVTSMAWVAHASNVPLDPVVDIPPTNGVMGGDVEATIENLEPVSSRLGCCYNELHMIILFLW